MRKNKSFQSADRMAHRKTKIFHATNKRWNQAKLNRSYVIGSLNILFRKAKPLSMEEWEDWYYRSGEERKQKLRQLPKEKRALLEDFTVLHQENYEQILKQLSPEEIALNTEYGRTKEDLAQIASYFKKQLHLEKRFQRLSFQTIYEYVLIRVLNETFIGFSREQNTIRNLQLQFPQYTFQEVSSEKDVHYAIDCEVFIDDKLAFALQIKSSRYLSSSNQAIHHTKKMNYRKNKDYQKDFGVPVYYLYASASGNICNPEILSIFQSASAS